MPLAEEYLRDVAARFHDYKALSDKAIAQVSDEELTRSVDPESNSIAVVMRHMAGNMRSRWRDFLTTDGEKPDRHRDGEFELPAGAPRAAMLADWESGWACLFEELGRLGPGDLDRAVRVRQEPLSVVSAINRQLGHAAYHAGQIVFLAKHLRAGGWTPLTIPRGQSEQFNARMAARKG